MHIVGPFASILIQEVVVSMRTGGRLDAIVESVHAHPALRAVARGGGQERGRTNRWTPAGSTQRQDDVFW